MFEQTFEKGSRVIFFIINFNSPLSFAHTPFAFQVLKVSEWNVSVCGKKESKENGKMEWMAQERERESESE
jgi:hypothetical protein